jgi:hypothetical protein
MATHRTCILWESIQSQAFSIVSDAALQEIGGNLRKVWAANINPKIHSNIAKTPMRKT